MTSFSVKFLYFTMTAMSFGGLNIVWIVWFLIFSLSFTVNKPFSSPLLVDASGLQAQNQNNEVTLSKKYEQLIKAELAEVPEEDLVKEVKLAAMSNTIGGPTHFYTFGGKSNKEVPVFSWVSPNVHGNNIVDDIIVLGVHEKSYNADEYLPLGWMSGTFVALRKTKESGTATSSFMTMINFYAVVAYVRKDAKGSTEIIEWDRFSMRIVRNLFEKETILEVSEAFTIDSLLCSYGTCACAACKCGNETNIKRPNLDGPKTLAEAEEAEIKRENRRKFNAVASAIAKSSKGNVRAKSEASGFNSHALSHSKADEGNAVAESVSHKGASMAIAEARNDSIAEALGGKQGASASAATSKGTAQSTSQSRGGHLEAQAIRTGSQEEYNYYDENPDESDEDFDAKALVRDTNQRFAEANARSEKMRAQSAGDMCVKEYDFEVNMTILEFDTFMQTDKFRKEHKKIMKKNEQPSYLYRNPTRYGMNVLLGINSTVLIATVIPGFAVPRDSCCGLEFSFNSSVQRFLKTFKQECNTDLQTQVKRLEISYDESRLESLMLTKKLSLTQLRDLVPMILLTVNERRSIRKTIRVLKRAYTTPASDDVNRIVAVLIHGAHYAMYEGYMHKIKILKGLVLNVRTVLTGVLLEFKRCKKEQTTECGEHGLERLRTEKRMILGVYYFLKFADSRYYYFRSEIGKPGEAFVDFMKVHGSTIGRLVYCKSRRIILNTV